jgi:hypothetical protein
MKLAYHYTTGSRFPWDSVPASFKSRAYGSEWVDKKFRLVLDVPSVIVPQERNYLLNPLHKGIAKVKATNLGRFSYDPRLRPLSASLDKP